MGEEERAGVRKGREGERTGTGLLEACFAIEGKSSLYIFLLCLGRAGLKGCSPTRERAVRRRKKGQDMLAQ